jgi:hypothetical protein
MFATLVCAASAVAHEGGEHTGFVSTVSTIDPPQLGLLVRVVGGHESLSVRNLTKKRVVILGETGQPTLQLAPGRSGSVRDRRIGSTGPPPAEGEFVKNWRIPGRAGGAPFEIVGFLGYRAPVDEGPADWTVPAWAIALAIVVGGSLVTAALALPLIRRKGES